MKTRLLPLLILTAVTALSRSVTAQLTAADVQTVIDQAVARAVKISPNSVIAVTDREGYVLAVWVVRGGPATVGEIATAVSKAGTASYLSSNQNAFTSRTAGFIIQQHFPPGVQNTPTGPLVGVGLSNLFVSDVNRFKKTDLVPCTGTFFPCAPATEPVSPGVLGSPIGYTSLDGSPGGVPLYKNGILVGGIGVTGDGTPQPPVLIQPDVPSLPILVGLPTCLLNRLGERVGVPPFTNPPPPFPLIGRDENPFIFIGGYDQDEDVALAGEKGFTPSPTITADNVFINGIRLPYVVPPSTAQAQVSAAAARRRRRPKPTPTAAPTLVAVGNADPEYPVQGAPAPFPYPAATFGGYPGQIRQTIIDDPIPTPIQGQPRLTAADVVDVINFAAARARITRAGIRLPIGVPMAAFITVVNNPDADGCPPVVLGTFRTGEATLFSWDVAVQKARTSIFYSRHDFLHFGVNAAFSSRAVGFLAQRFYPPGIVDNGPGPFFTEQDKLSGLSGAEPNVTFTLKVADPTPPGALPLRNGLRFDLPNGITIFPGGFPLYRNGVLIGAVGISGDGVDQDDITGASGTHDFLAPMQIRSDQFSFQGARLPYAKFPRDPGK